MSRVLDVLTCGLSIQVQACGPMPELPPGHRGLARLSRLSVQAGSRSWRSEGQHEWLTAELSGTSALTWRSAGLARQPRQQLGHPWWRIGGHCVHRGPVPCHGGGPPAQRSLLIGLCGLGEPDQRAFLQLANALAAFIQLAGERIVCSRLRREGAGGEDQLAPFIGFP